LADWYVFQHDGDPLGPWSTDTVANEILAGRLAPDIWVAAPGGQRWLRALDVPVISRLVDGVPTKPRRRDSGLRLMPAAFVTENGMPAFGSTMMIVSDEELETSPSSAPASGPSSSAQTRRGAPPADDTAPLHGFAPVSEMAPPTDRVIPPSSSSTPEPPTPVKKVADTREMPSSDRRKRRKNG
jgi:hypothetical protein